MKSQFPQGNPELLRFIGAKPFDLSRAEEFLSSIPYINEILREECDCPAAWVDNEYLGADTLAFLLENCANYNALAEERDFSLRLILMLSLVHTTRKIGLGMMPWCIAGLCFSVMVSNRKTVVPHWMCSATSISGN